jgi:hypothetical protein
MSAEFRPEEGSSRMANPIGWEQAPLPRTGGAPKRSSGIFGFAFSDVKAASGSGASLRSGSKGRGASLRSGIKGRGASLRSGIKGRGRRCGPVSRDGGVAALPLKGRKLTPSRSTDNGQRTRN